MIDQVIVRIEYPEEYEQPTEVFVGTDQTRLAKWMFEKLNGWCVDLDLKVFINGERQ